MPDNGSDQQSPNVFLAIKFKGDDDAWADTGTSFAPTGTAPDILGTGADGLSLYDESQKGKSGWSADGYKSGVWSNVRHYNLGASLAYTGTKGSGVPEVGGRPNHENTAMVKKSPDDVTPRLFEIVNTGHQLENLVIYHPGWELVISYEEVNLTSINFQGGRTQRFYIDNLTQETETSWDGKGEITRSSRDSVSSLYDYLYFIYGVVTLSVCDVDSGWDVERAVKV